MKTSPLVLSFMVFLSCLSVSGVLGQERMKLKLPTVAIVSGFIQHLDKAGRFIILRQTGAERTKAETKIYYNDKTKIVIQGEPGRVDDLKLDQEVMVKYITHEMIPIVGNVPKEKEIYHISEELIIVQRGEKKSKSEGEVLRKVDIHNIVNDYLILSIVTFNVLAGDPETVKPLKDLVNDITKRYDIPPQKNGKLPVVVGFSEGSGMKFNSQEMWVPYFGMDWVDLMSVLQLKETGKMPRLMFRNGEVDLAVQKDGSYHLQIKEKTEVKIEQGIYIFSQNQWIVGK